MQAIYNTKTSIITRMIDTSEQNIGKYLNENEDYKQIPFSNDLSKGQDISKFTDEGRLRPNSELLAENLITLQEDQILDGEVIRDLTEDELKEKYPLRYSVPEQTDLEQSSPEKAALDLLAKQEFRAENLKEQYLETDLNDNKDPILDNEVIRDLTEDESKVTPPQIYSVPEQIVPAQISPITTILELLAEKESKAKNLKEQYLEADLDDNEDLKSSLKIQIQELRREISILKG